MENNDFLEALREQERILGEMRSSLHRWMDELLRTACSPETLLGMAASMGLNLAGKQDSFDPYRVLGLEHAATDAEVKTRYRELLKNLHPDTSTIGGTDFLLQVVIAAYQKIAEERQFTK